MLHDDTNHMNDEVLKLYKHLEEELTGVFGGCVAVDFAAHHRGVTVTRVWRACSDHCAL